MKYLYLEPEVGGGLGPGTIQSNDSDRPVNYRVDRLNYEFDVWLGDEILEATPCFIVTDRLAKILSVKGLSGVLFDDVEVSRSGIFEDMYPHRILPKFVWMKVIGVKDIDDFFIAKDGRLVLSAIAWDTIKPFAPHASALTMNDES